MGCLTRLCNSYTEMFSGHTKETVDEGSVGWKLFARLWGAVEGEDGTEQMRDLFEEEGAEDDGVGRARQQALRQAQAKRHQLTDKEGSLAMELSHLLKSEHDRQDKQKQVARVLKDWASQVGVDLFAAPGGPGETAYDDGYDSAVGPLAGDAGSSDIKARREWAVWGLAQREAKAARTRDAEKHTAESLAAAEQNWLEVMDDLKYYEREHKAIAHRGGAAAQEAELHLVLAQDKLGRAGALKGGAAEAWRVALAESIDAAEVLHSSS